MGVVFRARHRLMKKAVAVKMLHPEMSEESIIVERFFREARAASSIDHPNVCSATDFGQTPEGTLYLVMEYLEGHTLKAIINRDAPFSADRVVNILAQIASALSRAHALRIVHRDLKPDNVFLVSRHGQQDVVKILDFGLARVRFEDDESEEGDEHGEEGGKITLAGEVFGTPKYMAPEQAQGNVVDHRADLYALGIMAFEMLTGEPPFKASSAMQLLWQQAMSPPPTMGFVAPEVVVPIELEEIVMTLLKKDPDERYADAAALLQALQCLSIYDPSCLSLAPVTGAHPSIDPRAQGDAFMTIMTTAVPEHDDDQALRGGRDTIAMIDAPVFADAPASHATSARAHEPSMDTEPPVLPADTTPPVVVDAEAMGEDETLLPTTMGEDETLLAIGRGKDLSPRSDNALASIALEERTPRIDTPSDVDVEEVLPLKVEPKRSWGPTLVLMVALVLGVIAVAILFSNPSEEPVKETSTSSTVEGSAPATPIEAEPEPAAAPAATLSFSQRYQALVTREDLMPLVEALGADLAEARAEALAAIQAIADTDDAASMSPAMRLLLAQAHARGGKDEDAVGLLDGLLVRHREMMDEPLVLDTLMVLFSRKGARISLPAQRLVSRYFTEAVAERVLDAALFNKYLMVRRRARKLLASKDVIGTLPEWQQVSLALRGIEKGKCSEMRPLVDQLATLGESAALPVVEAVYQDGLSGCGNDRKRVCHGCMTENLQAAFSALKQGQPTSP